MATTKSNFVIVMNESLDGAGVVAAPSIRAFDPGMADQITGRGPGGTATANFFVDRNRAADLAISSYAKNGALVVTLTGTTPVDLSLIDLTSNATDTAGDTVFAKWMMLKFYNPGAADWTFKQAAATPANLLGVSTTPAISVRAGSSVTLFSVLGENVDSTHKLLTITPTSGGTCAIAVGGS